MLNVRHGVILENSKKREKQIKKTKESVNKIIERKLSI